MRVVQACSTCTTGSAQRPLPPHLQDCPHARAQAAHDDTDVAVRPAVGEYGRQRAVGGARHQLAVDAQRAGGGQSRRQQHVVPPLLGQCLLELRVIGELGRQGKACQYFCVVVPLGPLQHSARATMWAVAQSGRGGRRRQAWLACRHPVEPVPPAALATHQETEPCLHAVVVRVLQREQGRVALCCGLVALRGQHEEGGCVGARLCCPLRPWMPLDALQAGLAWRSSRSPRGRSRPRAPAPASRLPKRGAPPPREAATRRRAQGARDAGPGPARAGSAATAGCRRRAAATHAQRLRQEGQEGRGDC